ncbi:hypothetical protein CFHF_09610 [Caulobacter flavus]|uniref:TPM domain-containing protein n=1 Tax=Caulobacter flavus TaxID=1679497 RepID=A0A2N5CV63_9CAUL|nr:TPM domain-containing protein [Caulobacter flavus]AYV45455.1 hypothetical protein C1707_03895 [Caulobacter flavus]PLR17687.1 hypothetical protein CFHF_09610 [Caulobacter flavus]
MIIRTLFLPAAIAAAVAAACLSGAAVAAPRYEAWTGPVVDQADVLSPAQEQALTRRIAEVRAQTGRGLAVVVLSDLRGYTVSEYGAFLEQAWAIPEADRELSVILVVEPSEGGLAAIIGSGLPPLFNDALGEEAVDGMEAGLAARTPDKAVLAGADRVLNQLALPDADAREQAALAEQRAADRAAAEEDFSLIGVLGFALGLAALIGMGVWGSRMARTLPFALKDEAEKKAVWTSWDPPSKRLYFPTRPYRYRDKDGEGFGD